MTSQTDRSLPELFGDAMAQLAKLVGNEFALARAELSEKASQAGRAARTDRGGGGPHDTGHRRASVRRRRRADP
jgi:hypothetical protein